MSISGNFFQLWEMLHRFRTHSLSNLKMFSITLIAAITSYWVVEEFIKYSQCLVMCVTQVGSCVVIHERKKERKKQSHSSSIPMKKKINQRISWDHRMRLQNMIWHEKHNKNRSFTPTFNISTVSDVSKISGGSMIQTRLNGASKTLGPDESARPVKQSDHRPLSASHWSHCFQLLYPGDSYWNINVKKRSVQEKICGMVHLQMPSR